MLTKDFASGEGNYATWAPSFLVQINPDDTTTVLARATNQGDWIWDDSSRNDSMLGVLDQNAANSAALPGEWGKPVDWTNINRSSGLNLKPHQAADEPGTNNPTDNPSDKPGTNNPTDNPSDKPGTNNPTDNPSDKPGTNNPTDNPSDKPGTNNPTDNPSDKPGTNNPTDNPSDKPGTNNPTDNPSDKPGTNNPTDNPSDKPGNVTPTADQNHRADNNDGHLPQTGNKNAVVGLYLGSLLTMFGLAALDKRYNK